MAYEKLFTPGRIGPLTIRNRAVMSPMGTDFADTNGNASPRLIAYYAERAKGGIGLIINEYTGVDDVDSIPTQHNLRMAQDYNVKAICTARRFSPSSTTAAPPARAPSPAARI